MDSSIRALSSPISHLPSPRCRRNQIRSESKTKEITAQCQQYGPPTSNALTSILLHSSPGSWPEITRTSHLERIHPSAEDDRSKRRRHLTASVATGHWVMPSNHGFAPLSLLFASRTLLPEVVIQRRSDSARLSARCVRASRAFTEIPEVRS